MAVFLEGETTESPRAVGRLAYLIFLCRVPLVACLLLSAALLDFGVEGVFRDAFRNALFERDQLAFITIALAVAAISLRHTAEVMIARFAPALVEDRSVAGFLYWLFPRLLGLAPALAVAVPLLLLSRDPAALGPGIADGSAANRQAVAMVAAIVCLIVGAGVTAVPRLSPQSVVERAPISRFVIAILFVLALIAMVAFLDLRAVWIPQRLGPVTIVLLWAFAVAALFHPLAYAASAWRVPLLTMLLLYAVGLSYFDLNDNHEVRRIDPEMNASLEKLRAARGSPGPGVTIGSFSGWLESRSDIDEYDHYPVFIVATEGGALRSGYYTASLLAAFQDICPAFAQHTFVISSVSGGSIGGATFTALAADGAERGAATQTSPVNAGCDLSGEASSQFRRKVRKVLSIDMLSPLLGAMLFPDALQRILPVPIGAFDRARALEYALEDAWRSVNDCARGETRSDCEWRKGRFSAPLAELHSAEFAQDMTEVPYLLPNVTRVETGAPEGLRDRYFEDLLLGDRDRDCNSLEGIKALTCIKTGSPLWLASLDIPLSTAAVLSARFPYVTPAGLICWKADPGTLPVDCAGTAGDPSFIRHRYVDGGYFENSGSWFAAHLASSTLHEKFEAAPDHTRLRRVHIVVLVLQATPTSETLLCDEWTSDRPKACVDRQRGLNEVLSPPRALLNTRLARTEVSKDDLRQLQEAIAAACAGSPSCAPMEGSYVGRRDAASESDANRYPFSVLTFRLHDGPEAEKANPDTIPYSWLLSQRSRDLIDRATDFVGTPHSWSIDWDKAGANGVPQSLRNKYAVLGNAKHLFCLLHMRKGVEAREGDVCYVKPTPGAEAPAAGGVPSTLAR